MEWPRLSPNRLAAAIAREIIEGESRLQVGVTRVAGAAVLDCGIKTRGGWQAGALYAAACMGGLGYVKVGEGRLGQRIWPAVKVSTDHPTLACILCQYAGWFVKRNGYIAMASGPARALVRAEDHFDRMEYKDSVNEAVIALETRKLPDAGVITYLSERCRVDPANLYVLVAPTSSQAGSVQIAARAVETGIHKMLTVGYDPQRVLSGWGTCPIPPVASDDGEALGRTNDAVLYGSVVHYLVDDSDDALEDLVARLPSQASRDWGEPFGDLFKRYGDFYSIDPHLFSPAEVALISASSGRTFRAGALRPDILEHSFCILEAETQ
jgi:methenyltetrahydromethanopterin cyclohydrolase